MATYIEIRTLYNDSTLRNRVAVGVAVAADKVMRNQDTIAPFSQAMGAHDKRKLWATFVTCGSRRHEIGQPQRLPPITSTPSPILWGGPIGSWARRAGAHYLQEILFIAIQQSATYKSASC